MAWRVLDNIIRRSRWLTTACRRQTIFLSYSSHDRARAEEIAQALITDGHRVFFDRRSLKGGDDYTSIIRRSIAASDRFIFLISAHSLAGKAYTLTELEFARAKWPSPAGPILPVLIDAAVPVSDMPVYLRSINILQPQGNDAAEIVQAIDDMSTLRTRCKLLAALPILAILVPGAWLATGRHSPPDVVLEPFEKVHFRPLVEPPANTAEPGSSTAWETSPVTITMMPVVYNHRSPTGARARLLDERLDLTVGGRHYAYRWAYVVEINTRQCADWLCVTANAGPSTLVPGELSPSRETMFLPASDAVLSWRELFQAILKAPAPTVSVTFRAKLDLGSGGDTAATLLERTCTIDTERARTAFLRIGYTPGGRAMAPFVQSSCEETGP